ncbi:MAG: peptidase C1 [Bacteroidetes bacterium]|nr:peptidase C1 [Bacteroidota bacterium]
MKFFFSLMCLLILTSKALVAQTDGKFVPVRKGFYDSLETIAGAFQKREGENRRIFKADFSGISKPAFNDFKPIWHTAPISQGITGTCWSFATTSFYESEIKRISGREVKLSELYTVYWEYVEKARRFVRERGNSFIGEGSETNAVARIFSLYGAIPAELYDGMKKGQQCHDHRPLFDEIKAFLEGVKASASWNEEWVISTIRSILNHHLGEPPTVVKEGNKSYSPQEYLKQVLRLNPGDYVDFMSLMEAPYFTKAEYKVPDNWWRSADYHNVPLNDFMNLINSALDQGFTLAIGGDVSEAGIDGFDGIAIVPEFDLPAGSINESARQYRFLNGTSTDDHALHLVGKTVKEGKLWYLIKDSGAGSRNHKEAPGYYFYREDFVKLKMLSFTVHKDAVKQMLSQFKKG